MNGRLHPALVPAAALLAGCWLGVRVLAAPLSPTVSPSVLLTVLLAAAGTALGGRRGLAVAAFAAGLTAAAVAGPAAVDRVDRERPVTVIGRVTEHPRYDDDGWLTRFAVERVVQRRTVAVGPGELWLALPGAEPPPGLGTRLRLRGYLSRSSGYANAVAVAPGPWRLRVKSRRLLAVETPPGRLADLATSLRRRVEAALRGAAGGAPTRTAPAASPRGGSTEPAVRAGFGVALVRALVLADSGGVPERWRRGLRRAGLAHLLAVSGLHVALVAAVALLLALPLPPTLRGLAVLPAVVLYLLLAGPRPALLRATLMGVLAGIATLAGRPVLGGNALAVAAAGLAVHSPRLVTDLGFQLTVAATAGLLFLGPPAAAAARRGLDGLLTRVAEAPTGDPPPPSALRRLAALPLRLLRAAAAPLCASVGAQVGSAPFALPAFHLLSWLAPVTNLVAVPWTALFLALALVWTVVAVAHPPAASALVPWLDAAAAPFGWPAAGSPTLWGTLPLAAPPAAVLPAALGAALWMRRPRRWGWLLLPLLLAPVVRDGFARGSTQRRPAATVEVVALDVGQGDAVLLRDGDAAVLVDGGGWRSGDFAGRVLLPALAGEGVHRLRAAVVTHPDADHCRGVAEVASYLPVDEVWTAPGWETDPCVGELVTAAVPDRPSRWHRLAAGDVLHVGRWRFDVLHPPHAAGGPGRRRRLTRRRGAGGNDRSLVLRAAALGRAVLLTGDVEAAAERGMLRRLGGLGGTGGTGGPPSLLRAAVLKVAHHGSKTSTTAPFLRAVAPRLALVSVGRRNPYGHPSPPVLERLRRAGVTVLRTDRDGALRLTWSEDGPLRLALGGD